MLHSSFHRLYVSLVLIILPSVLLSQPILTDVPAMFNAIGSKPQVLHLKKNAIKIPAGGHLQGIQCLDESHIVITASSASYSYYLTAQLDSAAGKGQINSLYKIADSPYRHAGGCQMSGNKLVVGIEDNHAKDKSKIVMVLLDDSAKQNESYIIAHRRGSVKRSTAGAVGFVKTYTDQYLVAVGDWDSRNIDFYFSRKNNDTLVDSVTTFRAPDKAKWCSYQAINLLMGSDKIFLIGFGLDGANNRADLFEVIGQTEATYLRLISTRNFKCKAGASFRYASGIYVRTDGRLTIYSCGRNVSQHTAVNIFR